MTKACIGEKSFNRYIEDDLNPSELKEIEEHAANCGLCRAEFELWKNLKKELSAVSEISIPCNLKERVKTRISEEKIKTDVFSVRRSFAIAFVSIMTVYYILSPFIKPLIGRFSSYLIKTFSSALYSFLDFLGIDPAIPFKLFGNLMIHMDRLFWFFAGSTILMIVTFFALILNKKASMRTN